MASQTQYHPVEVPETTLAILGCVQWELTKTDKTPGNLGTALLCGVLTSILEDKSATATQDVTQRWQSHEVTAPTSFAACVRTSASASRLNNALAPFRHPVAVHHNQNSANIIDDADIIVLGCQPTDLHECLDNAAMKSALRGKLLISLLAGVKISDIESILQATDNSKSQNGPTIIVRAMPNTASFVKESMTVIETPPGTPSETLRVIDWIFGSIGNIKYMPTSTFDACTALCASSPAFFAVFLEALVDGAVATGLSRSDAQEMAAQAMKGTAELILAGEHPVSLKEKITTPGGSTIRGVLRLEQGNMRAVVASALIDCKTAAETLGKQRT